MQTGTVLTNNVGHFCIFTLRRYWGISCLSYIGMRYVYAKKFKMPNQPNNFFSLLRNIFFFLDMFLAPQRFIFHNFLLCCPSQRSARAKCRPRWQPTRRWAISCGLGRRWIRTRDWSGISTKQAHPACSWHGFLHQRMNTNGTGTKWFIFLKQ